MTYRNYRAVYPRSVVFNSVDDSVSVDNLKDISDKHRYVEWNLHYYLERQGASGYPKKSWVDQILSKDINLSVKLSGNVAYEMLSKKGQAKLLIKSLIKYKRIHFNFPFKNDIFTDSILKYIYDELLENKINFSLNFDDIQKSSFQETFLSFPSIHVLYQYQKILTESKKEIYNQLTSNKNNVIGFTGDINSDNIRFEYYTIQSQIERKEIENYWIEMGESFNTGRYNIFKVRETLEKLYF